MGGMRPPPALLLLALAGCSDATPVETDAGNVSDRHDFDTTPLPDVSPAADSTTMDTGVDAGQFADVPMLDAGGPSDALPEVSTADGGTDAQAVDAGSDVPAPRCDGGLTYCPSVGTVLGDAGPPGCTDLMTDSRNCSVCGAVCAAANRCAAGTCVPR